MNTAPDPITEVYIVSARQGNLIISAFAVLLALIVMLMIFIYLNRLDIDMIDKQLAPDTTQTTPQENQ